MDALPISEADLQASVIELAERLGWLWHHETDSRRTHPGWLDLVLVRDRVIFAELKNATRQLTPEQTVWVTALQDAGQEVHIWRPEQWRNGEIEAVLRHRAKAAA